MPQFGLRIRLRAVPLTGQEPETNKLFEMMESNSQLIDSFKECKLKFSYFKIYFEILRQFYCPTSF